MNSQVLQKLKNSDRRCLYSKCNALLIHTFRKDQKCCNTNHSNLYKMELISMQKKLMTKIRKDAKLVYVEWLKTKEPIYKLTLINQLRIKYMLLGSKTIKSTDEYKRAWNNSYYHKVKKKKYAHYRLYHRKIILNGNFRKFWDRIEKK